MRQITLAVPDDLAQRLDRLAAEQQKSVEQVTVEQLAAVLEAADVPLRERYERFASESGLFVEFSEEEKQRYPPVSEERLRELGAKLATAGPLSEIIIEERGER